MKNIIVMCFFFVLLFSIIIPAKAQASCDGSLSPAYFSLYKNRKALFSSSQDADAMQRYKVEWFVGQKSMGSVIKQAGESFEIPGSSLTSQSFSITGFYRGSDKWELSRHKIFPGLEGGMQVRFDDGACDNSFTTSPDLSVTIKIN